MILARGFKDISHHKYKIINKNQMYDSGEIIMKYIRFLTLLIVLLTVGCGGGSIKSGNSITGAFTETVQLKSYTFDIIQGDSIHFSADSSKQTFLSIYDENDVLLGTGYNGYYFNSVQSGGTYRVDIVPRYADSVDDFTLHYVNGTTANEHGELVSGDMVSESITSNDLDSFTLLAVTGDSIHLSVDSSKQTLLYVYKPDGSLLGSSYNGFYANNLPQSGMYHIVVQGRYSFMADNFNMHYVNGATSNEHGELVSGDMVSGALTSNDLDAFILSAETGDSIHLLLDSSNQTLLYVYNPDGGLLGTSYNGFYANNLPQDGEYRVLVRGRYAFTTDDFHLHYVNGTTANEHGELISGAMISGELTSNDLDTFTFSVVAGDSVHMLLDSANQVLLYVYNPDGSLLGTSYNGFYANNLAQGGEYRVLVKGRYAFTVDEYSFHFANGSTANEYGFIDSGSTVQASFTSNDLDSYQFTGAVGGSVTLSTAGDTQTYLSVYQPDGTLLGHAYNNFTALNLDVGGTYRVIVQSRYVFAVGDYSLSLN